MNTYKAVRGGLSPDGGVLVLVAPGEPDRPAQTFPALADAQARADELNALEEAKAIDQ